MRLPHCFLAFLLLISVKPLLAHIPALHSVKGRVVKIVDGDTYDLLLPDGTLRIRMEGIDAPEKGMAYYHAAKNYLGALCSGKVIRAEYQKTDRYGRCLAKSYLPDGTELSASMLAAGMAWHYKKYNQEAYLDRLERQARKARKGLWAESNPIAPWDYRKARRKK
jgi:endonuclease YncB( thermonuclease family)